MRTGFQVLHPLLAFLYYVGVLTMTMLFNHPLFLLTALTVMLVLWLIVDRGRPKVKLVLFFLFMALLVIIINPIFSRRGATILFYFLDQPLTLESIIYGLLMAISLLTIMISFQSFNRVLSGEKLTYLFGSIVPKATLVLVMSLRFVPLLYYRLEEVLTVQRTQGIIMGEGRLKQKIRQGMDLLSILLTWSLEEAIQTAQSMRARGYGLGKRGSYRRYPLRKGDLLLLAYLLATVGLSIWGQLTGHGVLAIYPRLDSLTLHITDWLYYLSFCAFLGIPFYLYGKEYYIWRFFKSRTYPSVILKQAKKL